MDSYVTRLATSSCGTTICAVSYVLNGVKSLQGFQIEVNESRFENCGVTPYFSTEQSWEKRNIYTILGKEKYLHNQLRKAFW